MPFWALMLIAGVVTLLVGGYFLLKIERQTRAFEARARNPENVVKSDNLLDEKEHGMIGYDD